MSLWRDESSRGRIRRAGVSLLIGAVVAGGLAAAQFSTVRSGAIAMLVAAVCMAIAGACLLSMQGRVMSAAGHAGAKPHRAVSVDPGRYLAPRRGRPATVDSLRRTRMWHQQIGSLTATVAFVVAAVSTLASGASGLEYALVAAAVSVFIVIPLLALVVVDRLRINRAIDILLESDGAH